MGDIVNGDKFVFGNNSRMIKIEIKNNFGPNSEGNNTPPDSGVKDAEDAEFEEVVDADNTSSDLETNEVNVIETSEDDGINERTDDAELIKRLNPIFYNNEDDVRAFLKEIRGMKDKDITDLVNKWVQNKHISDYGNSRKGDLWTILKGAGLYKSSRQNWCRRVY
jgi:hypothetical protein